MTHAVLGREAELAAVMRVLEQPLSETRMLVLSGDAGIGKSVLWHEGLRLSQAQGWRTLASRPTDADHNLPFTVLGDLCDPLLDDFGPSLPVPQREAIDIALLRREATGPRPDLRAVALAARGLLRAAAATGPLVLAIDDLQWMDAASARVIEFALRRLEPQPIRVMVALRGVELNGWATRVGRSIAGDECHEILVGALSVDSVQELFRIRLDHSFPRPMLNQLHATAGGNPFFA